jgi:CHAT domain-containing protein
METRLITGDKAVEESFTQLSGNSSPSVIHIATHGFYFPDTITQVTDRDMLLMGAMGEERFRIYDDPLLRSALVMAGANRSWLGEELPPGAEDGILTAKDVSAMNLSNTELVVLSACQTGLGEVDGTEGVTGLQRGFKIAGVKYVMMSLWPVPDKETAEFMETFYSYWGEGIREAFHKTQQFMANKYRNEPYKWAGFVLVE